MESTTFTFVLAVLTLLAHVGLFTVLVLWLLRRRLPWFNQLRTFTKKNILQLGLIAATVATLSSLLYSEVFLLEPCHLCWYQRIFMYPLVFLFGTALIKKHQVNLALVYAKVLTWVGGIIALYHYLIQMSATVRASTAGLVNCSTVGMTPTCSSYFFLEFGYITIPMMSLTVFGVLLAIFYLGSE